LREAEECEREKRRERIENVDYFNDDEENSYFNCYDDFMSKV
jgi:hypothetical protein